MRFYCESCHAKYSIEDERVRGRVLIVQCKACGHDIEVRLPVNPTPMANKPYSPQPRRGSKDLRSTQITNEEPLEWYYAVNGQSVGAFRLSDIKKQFELGVVGDEAYIWHESLGDWTPVREVPEFTEVLMVNETRVGKRPTKLFLGEVQSVTEIAQSGRALNKSTVVESQPAEPRAEKIDELRRKLRANNSDDSVIPDSPTMPEKNALPESTKPRQKAAQNLRATRLAAPKIAAEAQEAAKKLSIQTEAQSRSRSADELDTVARYENSASPAIHSGEQDPRSLSSFGASGPKNSNLSANAFGAEPAFGAESAPSPIATPNQNNASMGFGGARPDIPRPNPLASGQPSGLSSGAGPAGFAGASMPAGAGGVGGVGGTSGAGGVGGAGGIPPRPTSTPSNSSFPNPSDFSTNSAVRSRPPTIHRPQGLAENTPAQLKRRESMIGANARVDLDLPSAVSPVETPRYVVKREQKLKRKTYIMIGVLLFLAAVGFIYFLIAKKSSPAPSAVATETDEHSADKNGTGSTPDSQQPAAGSGEATDGSPSQGDSAGTNPSQPTDNTADSALERPHPDLMAAGDGAAGDAAAPSTDSNDANNPVNPPSEGDGWQPTPPPRGVPTPKIPSPEPLHTLTRDQAIEGLKKVSQSVTLCRDRYIRRGGSFDTTEIALDLTVAGTGDVSKLEIDPDSLDGTEFVRCMRSQQPTWKFVAFGGAPQKVKRKFIIK